MGPHTQGPRADERRRVSARRRRHITLSVVLLVVLVASAFAFGATRRGPAIRRPPQEICVGETFRLGVRYRAWLGGSNWFRVRVRAPDGTALLNRRGWSSTRWRHWRIEVTEPGPYRIVYSWRQNGRRAFWTEAVDCSPSSGLFLHLPEGRVLFEMPAMASGTTAEACVRVGYEEGPPISVRLYGETRGTGLAGHLLLRVERGTMEPAGTTADCGGFASDTDDHQGLGPGVLYDGTLEDWPDDMSSAVVDPGTWSPGDFHAYRFVVSLPDDVGNEIQGLTALHTFVWEGQE